MSPDAILGQYLPSGSKASNLPGFGGVYNASNLNLYAYGHQNPVKYSDADGNVVFIPIIIGALWVADKAYAAYEAHQDYKAIQSGAKTLAEVAKDRAAEQVAGAIAGPIGRGIAKGGKHILKMADEAKTAGSNVVEKTASGKRVEDYTKKQRDAAKAENAADHGGTMGCTDCGKPLENIANTKGVKTPDNQAQVHHDPAIKDGGTKADSQPVVLCPDCHKQRHLNEQ